MQAKPRKIACISLDSLAESGLFNGLQGIQIKKSALKALAVGGLLPTRSRSLSRPGRACPGHPRRAASETSPGSAAWSQWPQKQSFLTSPPPCRRSLRRNAWVAGTSPAMTLRARLAPPQHAEFLLPTARCYESRQIVCENRNPCYSFSIGRIRRRVREGGPWRRGKRGMHLGRSVSSRRCEYNLR